MIYQSDNPILKIEDFTVFFSSIQRNMFAFFLSLCIYMYIAFADYFLRKLGFSISALVIAKSILKLKTLA